MGSGCSNAAAANTLQPSPAVAQSLNTDEIPQTKSASQSSNEIPQPKPAVAQRQSTSSSSGRQCLEATFCDNQGNERVLSFYNKPLGFEISIGVKPIRVDNVFSEGLAAKQGVEAGWYLTKVNGTVLSGMEFSEQFRLLKSAMVNLPLSKEHDVRPKIDALEIVFEDTVSNRLIPVTFSKKPLGIDFDMVAPITVKTIKEDCVAKRSGVETGWIVKIVAGKDISSLAVADQVSILKRCVGALPDVTYGIAPPASHCVSGNMSNERESNRSIEVPLDVDLNDGRL